MGLMYHTYGGNSNKRWAWTTLRGGWNCLELYGRILCYPTCQLQALILLIYVRGMIVQGEEIAYFLDIFI